MLVTMVCSVDGTSVGGKESMIVPFWKTEVRCGRGSSLVGFIPYFVKAKDGSD